MVRRQAFAQGDSSLDRGTSAFEACASFRLSLTFAAARALPLSAQCDAVIDGAVIANRCGLPNPHPHAMIDKEVFADGGPGGDFNGREPPPGFRPERAMQRLGIDPGERSYPDPDRPGPNHQASTSSRPSSHRSYGGIDCIASSRSRAVSSSPGLAKFRGCRRRGRAAAPGSPGNPARGGWWRAGDSAGGREAYNRGTEFALLLTLPAAVALVVAYVGVLRFERRDLARR